MGVGRGVDNGFGVGVGVGRASSCARHVAACATQTTASIVAQKKRDTYMRLGLDTFSATSLAIPSSPGSHGRAFRTVGR